MVDLRAHLRAQAIKALSETGPCITFTVRRPSGKNHELKYPREMFEDNFDGTLAMVEKHITHWMEWCDSQQVCPIKKNADYS